MTQCFPLSIICLLAILLLPAQASARDEIYTGTFSSKALNGYDTVAYFTEGKAVEGNERYSLKYKGAVWQFRNASNLKQFNTDPERYVPQYGGYCAWAVGHNYTAKGDPEAWSIVDNKLYLNYNTSIRKGWLKEKGNLIKQGDRNWPSVLNR